MTPKSRITLALASLLLLVMYVAPLWKITLEAPQYPEGLGLKIMLTDVQGQKPHDLNNINNLNHYIGMKRIEPDAIPELRVMPWIVAFLIVTGLGAAWLGKPKYLYMWCGLFLLVALAGLVDFWLWAYDYGHNLDTEHAAIKVPGMSYQPPIFGWKQLLNFRAHSWPALGGWAAFVSLAIGCALAWREFRDRKPAAPVPSPLVSAVCAVLLLGGCAPEPRSFNLGEDTDDWCRMTITDARFAAQVVTTTGKAYKFDSIECLRSFLGAGRVSDEEVHSIWVSDAADPGVLLPVESAFLVQDGSIRSPMGGGLAAFSTSEAAAAAGGTMLEWSLVVSSH